MKDIFARIKNINENWYSEELGSTNGNPVSIRVMIDKTTRTHTHESDDEMFVLYQAYFLLI